MKTLIIEDEMAAAVMLTELLSATAPYIEVLGVLQSIDEAVDWFRSHSQPDLVFMDIHLADGTSFSIFEHVTLDCPVIFTTAYDEYALRAFEVNSIDYLLKPINRQDLERAVRKFRNYTVGSRLDAAALETLLSSMGTRTPYYKSNLLIQVRDKLVPLSVREIAFFYIDTKVVKAVTLDGQTFFPDQNLDQLMEQLDPHDFFRANRQYIIARTAVRDISLWFGNKLSVNLTVPVPEKIIVSKARVKEFKNWIGG